MDYKITNQKSNPWEKIIVIFLSMMILVTSVFFCILHFTLSNRLNKMESITKEVQQGTTRVKQGDIDLSIRNITGIVRAKQSVNMYWQTSGTIEDVFVNIDDNVKQNQVLASLSQSSLDINILNAQIDIEEARKAYDALIANTEQIANTLSTLVTAQQTLKNKEADLNSLNIPLLSDVNLTLSREKAIAAQLDYDEAISKFDEVRDTPMFNETRERYFNDIRGYRNARDNTLAEYNQYLEGADQLEIQTREAAVALAKAQVEEAEFQYKKAIAGPTEAEKQQYLANIAYFQNIIDSSKIISPFDGVVTKIDAKAGDVISYDPEIAQRNVFAMRIEDISAFLIDTKISELYINTIEENMPVIITLDAIPNKTFHGVIYKISDVGYQSDSNIKFDVTVKIIDADESIKSGMSANLMIELDTIENAKYVPLSSIIIEDGHYFVSLLVGDNEFEPVPVEIGKTFDSSVQIISDDVQCGDEILLDVYGEEDTAAE